MQTHDNDEEEEKKRNFIFCIGSMSAPCGITPIVIDVCERLPAWAECQSSVRSGRIICIGKISVLIRSPVLLSSGRSTVLMLSFYGLCYVVMGRPLCFTLVIYYYISHESSRGRSGVDNHSIIANILESFTAVYSIICDRWWYVNIVAHENGIEAGPMLK